MNDSISPTQDSLSDLSAAALHRQLDGLYGRLREASDLPVIATYEPLLFSKPPDVLCI